MKRRRFDATSGLDLFLDAICNTFGGIVFISMLVVILINASSVSSVTDEVKVAPDDPKHYEKLIQEKARLLEDIQRQQEAMKILGDSTETSALLSKARQERVTQTQLHLEINELARQLEQVQAEIRRLSSARDQQTQLRKKLEALEKQLQREITKRTRQLSLPKETRTSLTEQAFFVKDDRLVEYKAENIEKDAGGIIPKPGVGVRVTKADLPEIETEFGQYDPQRHYIAIVLWEDSFSQWPTIQSALRQKGFSYRLILCGKDEKITTGGTSGKVQH